MLKIHFNSRVCMIRHKSTAVTNIIQILSRVRKVEKHYLLASSCLSVCASFRKEQLCSHWTDFHEI